MNKLQFTDDVLHFSTDSVIRHFRKVCYLWVDDDLQVHAVLLLQSLHSRQRDPQIVGVKDLELGDGLELVHMGLRDLSDL